MSGSWAIAIVLLTLVVNFDAVAVAQSDEVGQSDVELKPKKMDALSRSSLRDDQRNG